MKYTGGYTSADFRGILLVCVVCVSSMGCATNIETPLEEDPTQPLVGSPGVSDKNDADDSAPTDEVNSPSAPFYPPTSRRPSRTPTRDTSDNTENSDVSDNQDSTDQTPSSPGDGPYNPGDMETDDPTPDEQSPIPPQEEITNPASPEEPEDDGPPPLYETETCYLDATGNFVTSLTLNKGNNGSYDWAQGGGCVFRDIRETWAVLHNLEYMIWEGVTEIKYITPVANPAAGLTHQYNVKYYVDAFIDVDWVMGWYHSVYSGSFLYPWQILVNYKKTSGTGFISYWEGSIFLDYVTENVTSFWMRNHLDATQQDENDAQQTIIDVINKLRDGPPNWDRLNAASNINVSE